MNWKGKSARCWDLCSHRKPVSEVGDLHAGGRVIGQKIVWGKISGNLKNCGFSQQCILNHSQHMLTAWMLDVNLSIAAYDIFLIINTAYDHI